MKIKCTLNAFAIECYASDATLATLAPSTLHSSVSVPMLASFQRPGNDLVKFLLILMY